MERPTDPSRPPAPLAVITGSSGGIGRHVTAELARAGWRVIALVRAPDREPELRAFLGRQPDIDPDRVEIVACDLADPAQIRRAADRLASEERIERLIHCAGVFCGRPLSSPRGDDLQWAVNYLGPRLLTEALRARTRPDRVVLVASAAWHRGDPSDLGAAPGGLRGYRASKLALVLYGAWLASQGIDAHSIHPGVVRTDIGLRHADGALKAAWHALRALALSPADGASPIVRLARERMLPVPSGTYWSRYRPQPGVLDPLATTAETLERRTRGEVAWA